MSINNPINIIREISWIRNYSYLHYLSFFGKNFILSCSAYLLVSFSKKNLGSSRCDVLVLCRSSKSYNYNNLSKIFDHGIKYKFDIQSKPKKILEEIQLIKPSSNRFSVLYIYSAYAKYLIEKYKPKVIITENNGSILTSLLKAEASKCNIKIVHLAHSVTSNNYRAFSLIDFDYYFLFGQSSINYLKQRDRLFGTCRCVITGSWEIQNRLDKPFPIKITAKTDVFLLLGSGPSYEKNEALHDYYSLIIDFFKERNNSLLLFKPHPRSDLTLWRALTKNYDSSKFVIVNDLSNQMQSIKIAFCGYTNAILDIASIGIVPVLMANSCDEDLFEYESFFGPPVSTRKEIFNKINNILDNYHHYQAVTQKFSIYHLSEVNNPKKMIFNNISSIVKGDEIASVDFFL